MFDRLEIVHIVLVGMDMLGILELITKSWLGLLYFFLHFVIVHMVVAAMVILYLDILRLLFRSSWLGWLYV